MFETNTIQKPILFANPALSLTPPDQDGRPTLKVMFPTRQDICTREYLPVHLSHDFGTPLGSTWIPVFSLVPPGKEFYVLSVTHPLYFHDLNLFFCWDATIYPIQMAIPQSINNYRPIRQRSWNPSTGKSSLYNKLMYEPTDMETPEIHVLPPIKQAFTLSLSIEQNFQLHSILENGKAISPDLPSWGNLYIRVFGNKLKKYFVQRPTPTYNGITIHDGLDTLHFSQIKPISSPTFRFIYRKLSNYNGPYDWIPINTPEIGILSHKIPIEIHNKLTSLL
jgi:hypothetical protein